ncbi:S-layer family protein [Anaerobacterium chartisolvens]|uniref:S-layer family protein n=1 Tax=Anaerobacterium chartisolvens TaxID=1297424 RepID=A0A369ASJ5_9FIRM|nr:S-layer homology domain-containing protein [Anaerobacterium chartisolvens]RCX11236.1 S-layer family protein [Anaerobacterium chartisolvens]
MRVLKKAACIVLAVILAVQVNLFDERVYGADPQPPLQDLTVQSTGTDRTDAAANKCYVDLGWPPLSSPMGTPYLNFYVQEINKAYRPARPMQIRDRSVPTGSSSFRMKGLASGTFYLINAKAFYTYNIGDVSYTSPESSPSKTVKVLTDIGMTVASYGTNQIRIEWDDVWNSGSRIGYKLYVSDNSSFANTIPIYIGSSQIEPNGPVTVNQSTGKLEYIHQVNDPARVYYVKIEPEIVEEGVVYNPSTDVLPVSSYILVKTTRMSETEEGTIWRLDWTPVVTGLGSGDIIVRYYIYKYVNNMPVGISIDSGTSTFITVPPGEDNNYYMIRAEVTRNGVSIYPPTVQIISDRVLIREQEIPAVPAAPELVDEFKTYDGKLIISYSDQLQDGRIFPGELAPKTATILWRLPKKANGSVDTGIIYDMWIVDNPNQIDNPPEASRTELRLSPDENYVMEDHNHIGYKYKIENLTPNHTYYVKLAARKTYLEERDGILQSVQYRSLPAIKVVVTPTDGSIDQPLVPGRPPLVVLAETIKNTSATIQVKNKWYEKYVESEGRWMHIDPLNLPSGADADPIYTHQQIRDYFSKMNDGIFEDPSDPELKNFGKTYRIVEYDSGENGVTLDVGCIEYQEGMNLDTLKNLPANKVIGFPVTANDAAEDVTLNFDNKRHNVNIPLTALTPNTKYIIWVRASRVSQNLTSPPSDALLLTTYPDDVIHVEKPTVPEFTYYQAGDTYVDLGWNIRDDYTYHLKYGTTDNVNAAGNTITTTAKQIKDSGRSYLRIQGLQPSTIYYFFIQAEAKKDTLTSLSEWSDSLPVKTLAQTAPDTPRGFGVKNSKDAVTKNSITFEWIQENGLQYIVEVTGGIDYKDVKEYSAGAAAELKVDSLRSNFRYFARLYAYDPVTQLRSEPTQSITVRTQRSDDDYDSDEDIEDIASGDYIVKGSSAVKNVWSIKITGINADRFVEHIKNDNVLDYKLDAGSPPANTERINILVSNKVFNSLSVLKENLIISIKGSRFVIRPEVLTDNLVKISSPSFNYQISLVLNDTATRTDEQNVNFKTNVVRLEVSAYDGGNSIPVNAFNKPLKVIVPYDGSTWYKEGITSGYVYDDSTGQWKKAGSSNTFDIDNERGNLSFETIIPGGIAAADTGKAFFDDIYGTRYEDSITKIASVYNLKSVSGRTFRPSKSLTVSDGIKLVMDVYGYSYGADFMSTAAKAGFIAPADISNASAGCTREKATVMAVRLYELKTGEKSKPDSGFSSGYSDLNGVAAVNTSRVRFAIQNGMVEGKSATAFGPKDIITRGELMGILEKVLVIAGEIN